MATLEFEEELHKKVGKTDGTTEDL